MATGDIGTALATTLVLNDGTTRTRGDIAHVVGDYFAAVYVNDTDEDLKLKTFQLVKDGTLSDVQDSLTIKDLTAAVWPGIVKVADGMVAISYDDPTIQRYRHGRRHRWRRRSGAHVRLCLP